MATNKPYGDKARKGAVRKRSQVKNPKIKRFVKRNREGGKDNGKFMDVKKEKNRKFKGVRKEKK